MLMGAAIGAVVGLVIFLVQQQQKKKSGDTLDSDVTDSNENTES